MYKNMRNSTQNTFRPRFIMASMMLMLVCLLVTRAALSASMIIFLGATLIHKNLIGQLKDFLHNYLLLGIFFLFFIPFISGLWSSDLTTWLDVVRVKLPLVLFPIAFAGTWQLNQKQWLAIAIVFLLVVTAGAAWSLSEYIKNAKAIHEGYLKAKVFATPLENDHVRFSWLVAVAVICCALLIDMIKTNSTRLLITILIIFLVVYLHILSARTGLLSFYLFLLLCAIRLAVQRKKVKYSLVYLMILITLPLIAWLTIPTFQNRIRYLRYDLSYIKSSTYLPGSDDGVRFLSIKGGWQILKQHPLGVGAGDVIGEVGKWYTATIAGMLSSDKSYPSSEWLVYGLFAGWPGIIAFTGLLLLPFFKKPRNYTFFWIALNSIAAFSFVFDIGLEVQYGVFIYSFIILWWYKWLNQTQKFLHGR